MKPVELNDRQYRRPRRPTVVICADGCDPSYLEAGFAAGVLPTIAKWRDDGICFSSEQADRCTSGEHGIAEIEALVGRSKPDMYSADLSLFVLDAGIRLVQQGRARLLYLSLSDYVQHGHAPDEPAALAFHQAMDQRLARFAELGCVVAVTADHGMNDKALPDGRPHVLYLEDILNAHFGAGAVRVICPIADPFVRHHGALGSFVRLYRKADVPIATL